VGSAKCVISVSIPC